MRSLLAYGLGFIALLLLQTVLTNFQITMLNYIGLAALVAVGLVLLTGVGAMTSFGQAAFVGLGAYTTAYMTTVYGTSPWLTLLVALTLVSTLALFLGWVTMSLSSQYLPLGTLAWGISIYFLFGSSEKLGAHSGIAGIPNIPFFEWEIRSPGSFLAIIWAVLLVAIWCSQNMLRSREGRAMRSLATPGMSAAMGIKTSYYRIVLFLIAAQLACVSGWLFAHMQRFISPTPFSLNAGIEFLFMAVLGGIGSVWGAVLGAGVVLSLKQVLQEWLPSLMGSTSNIEGVVFAVLVVVLLHKARFGLWSFVARFLPKRWVEKPIVVHAEAPALATRTLPPAGSELLRVKNVTKRFGGLVANNQMSLTLKAGQITALIGPNGAGKSTLFNCISGVSSATEGQIEFLGQPIQQKSAREIAALGLSRTFQHVRLNLDMTVLENVALGAHLRGHKNFVQSAWRLDRAEEQQILAEAQRQIERCGLTPYQSMRAGDVALGQQRIIEIARALCADPILLMLDEPAAGLRHNEKQQLAELLTQLRADGVAVLLVEHDMDFLMSIADQVVVMEFGQWLAAGTPAEIQANPKVLEAYLGAEL